MYTDEEGPVPTSSEPEGAVVREHAATSRKRIPLGHATYVLDHSAPRATSTFGFPMSAADEFVLEEGVTRLIGGPRPTEEQITATVLGYRRDVLVARAGHRWSGDPLSPRNVAYVPGDTCGLRASAFQGAYSTLARFVDDPKAEFGPDDRGDVGWEVAYAAVLYGAVPYFVPTMSLLGIAGSETPTTDLFADIALPFPRVAVMFGADLALPPTLVGGEEILRERTVTRDRLLEDRPAEVPAHLVAPNRLHAAMLGRYRNQPVWVAGVVISAGADGRGLDDLVMWLTVTETHDGLVARRSDPGSLSVSHLAPIVHNIAAAVAWGSWREPQQTLELPDDVTSKAFRDALRRGQFRRREPSGAAVGVHVIDVAPPRQASSNHGSSSHASPVTHLRRGHSRRQRVGPHDDWRYETRWISPVLVNPSYAPGPGGVTVYRLPDPNLD
jgi:hypothetical protein